MGHIIPIDKSGKKIPGAETPIFNNDPNDPTKGIYNQFTNHSWLSS